jgi:hypothetical protein
MDMQQRDKGLPKNKGYFLVLILIFMHIFSIAAIYELSELKDQFIQWRMKWQIGNDNIQSEHVLLQLERELAEKKFSCLVPNMASYELKYRELKWWMKNGCQITVNDVTFFYIIESVKHNRCAEEIKNQQIRRGFTYYRVSVRRHQSQSILQTIIALHEKQKICDGKFQQMPLGRHSWREL